MCPMIRPRDLRSGQHLQCGGRSVCNVSPDGHARDTSMRTRELLEGFCVVCCNTKRPFAGLLLQCIYY